MKIRDVIAQLRDGHTRFTPPCVAPFTFVLPYCFTFTAEGTPKADGSDITVKLAEHDAYNLADWIEAGHANLTGKVVTHLILNDIPDGPEDETPATTLSRWAYTYIHNIRTPPGQLNRAVFRQFFYRGLKMFPMPPENITVQYLDESGKNKTEVLPFFLFINMPVLGTNFLCPVYKKDSVTSSQRSSRSFNFFNETINRSRISALESFPQDELEKEEEELFRASTRLAGRAAAETSSARSNSLSSSDTILISSPLMNVTEFAANADNTKDIHIKLIEQCQGYIFPSLKTAMLVITTWNPGERNFNNFTLTLYNTLSLAKAKGIPHFIVHQPSNGGGSGFLMRVLRLLLFPRLFPPGFEFSMPIGNVSRFVLPDLVYEDEIDATTNLWDWGTKDVIKDLPYVKVSVSGAINGTNVTRSRMWTRRFRMTTPSLLDKLTPETIPQNIYNITPYTPQNLVFMTDSFCASACCMTVKWAQQNRLGKVVSYGADIYNPHNLTHDVGNNPSGPVFNINNLLSQRDDFNVSMPLPQPFLRQGTDLSFTSGATFSHARGLGENETMMEYKAIASDYVLRRFPKPVVHDNMQELKTLVAQVQPVFDQCFQWEVLTDIAGCKDGPTTGSRIPHALYGHPCNVTAQTFDQNTCVFHRCEDGYYLSISGKECIPAVRYLKPAPVSRTKVIVIVLAVSLSITLISAGIIFLACFCHRKHSDPTYVYLPPDDPIK